MKYWRIENRMQCFKILQFVVLVTCLFWPHLSCVLLPRVVYVMIGSSNAPVCLPYPHVNVKCENGST